MTDSNLINLGGLYLSKTKSGQKYLSGKIGWKGKIIIFPIRNPKDGGPTHSLLLGEWTESGDEGKGSAAPATPPSSDDIPF